ncbi:MAG TPA: hypothetical protein VLB51_00660 [Methylomirabilota bacterium]|nr:hypothetical protein [Methylomirabilota bacterium]
MILLFAGGWSAAASTTDDVVPPDRERRFVRKLVSLAFILTVSLAHSGPVIGQGTPGDSDAVPPAIRDHYAEIIRAQAVLVQVPRMIMQDEALKAQHLAFAEALEQAMVALEPETTRRLERVGDLQRQAAGAPGSQEALLDEGRRLRDALLATAEKALNQPSVVAAAEPLLASLTAAFEQLGGVDPQTLKIVTDEGLLLKSVTAMTVFGR